MCGTCEVKDDFIGQTFPTPKGGVLTVVGDNGLKGDKNRYKVTCSICSLDTELFPDLFYCVKSKLVNGQCPCGCAFNPKWKESQVEIRIKRKLSQEGDDKFCGWVGEKYQNNNTKAIIFCSVHNKDYTVTSSNFFKDRKCPDCGHEKRKHTKRIHPDVLISRIKSKIEKDNLDVFFGLVPHEGEIIDTRVKLKLFCKTHNSMYDTTSYDSFMRGSRCPDCGYDMKAENRRLSTEDAIFQIESSIKLNLYNSRFLRFDTPTGVYKNWKTMVVLYCQDHDKEYSVMYNKLVCRDQGCPSCATHGYQPAKHGHLYVTNWKNNDKDTNEFFKIGISNDYTRRMKEQSRKTSYKPHQLIVFKFEDGSIPPKLERLTKPYRQDMEHPIIAVEEFSDGTTEILQNWIDIIKILPDLIDSIRQNGYTPEIEVGKRLYNKLIKLDKADMVQVILDHIYK